MLCTPMADLHFISYLNDVWSLFQEKHAFQVLESGTVRAVNKCPPAVDGDYPLFPP